MFTRSHKPPSRRHTMEPSAESLPVAPPTKRVASQSPFDQGQQLVADQDIEEDITCDVFTERQRLKHSLRAEELDMIHRQLWYAGRIGNMSPLHHQKVLRRDIILTERARLHLVWFERTIYVQRLDDRLLNWKHFSDIVCGDMSVYHAATGFLLSYAHLISYPSDLELAKASGLINKSISWRSWRSFRHALLDHLTDRDIHDRFEYGELRLDRLNQIYRMRCLGLAYFNIYRDYSSYFGDNYMTLVALFALVSVALSAMQVMTSVDGVPSAVTRTSYRFSVATLVALAGSCAVLLALYLGLYVWNWALILVKRRSSQRRGRMV